MASDKYKVVSDIRCQLGEGPVWDQNTQSIIWLDIIAGQIHEYHVTARIYRQIEVGRMVGAVALTQRGHYIAALEDGISRIRRNTGEITPLLKIEGDVSTNRFNDGKCDPNGRFWAGTMSLTEDQPSGSLYAINRDLSWQKKVKDVTISNGLAWSIDKSRLFYIDSPTRQVVAYDFDNATGSIDNGQVVIQIPEAEGFPDGMTIDQEGKLWIAHWGGWQVARWDPETGQKLKSIRLPTAHITSCTFGGKYYSDLYITSAQKGLSSIELKDQPLAGSLFVVPDCDHKGIPAVRFGGALS